MTDLVIPEGIDCVIILIGLTYPLDGLGPRSVRIPNPLNCLLVGSEQPDTFFEQAIELPAEADVIVLALRQELYRLDFRDQLIDRTKEFVYHTNQPWPSRINQLLDGWHVTARRKHLYG
jgi:hypothetical protein